MRKHPTTNIQPSTAKGQRARVLLMMALLFWGAGAGLAQSTNAPGRLTYDSFRMISDRNIFNPNRSPRSSGRPTTTRSTRPAQRVEYISLVGIMAYEKGVYAFFDGTSTDYKQALQTGGKIGEYRVARVSADKVQLATGTNTFDLKVGMQMRREDNGEWFLTDSNDETRRRVATAPVRTRTSRSGATEEGTALGMEFLPEGELPEIIVVEADPQREGNGEPTNGAAPENGNGDTAQVEPAGGDASGITDPVLLRLMQRRREMNQ